MLSLYKFFPSYSGFSKTPYCRGSQEVRNELKKKKKIHWTEINLKQYKSEKRNVQCCCRKISYMPFRPLIPRARVIWEPKGFEGKMYTLTLFPMKISGLR